MATLTTTFQSRELHRKVTFSAIIPTKTKSLYETTNDKKSSDEPLQTLYLLHGWDGNHEDWIQNSRIVDLATKHNIAVIMPSGDNSFYVDHPNRDNYGRFISEELVSETRELFSLSEKRKDTWVAGLSMGGYGALRNSLLYNETFSKVAAFSSRLLTKEDSNHQLAKDGPVYYKLRDILRSQSFSDLPKTMDVYELARKYKGKVNVFMACGTEDSLFNENRKFHLFLNNLKFKHDYYESAGGHKWDFWDYYIEKAIKWMLNN